MPADENRLTRFVYGSYNGGLDCLRLVRIIPPHPGDTVTSRVPFKLERS